jgi:hypothetical protein
MNSHLERREFLHLLEAVSIAGLFPANANASDVVTASQVREGSFFQILSKPSAGAGTSPLATSASLQTISNTVGGGIYDLNAAAIAISNGYRGGAQISSGPANPPPYVPPQLPESDDAGPEGFLKDDVPSNYKGFNPQTGLFFNVD